MNIDGFVEEVAMELGEKFVKDIRNGNEIAIATTELDKGENVKGEFVDTIRRLMDKYDIHGGLMPFPVMGKLLYVIRVREVRNVA